MSIPYNSLNSNNNYIEEFSNNSNSNSNSNYNYKETFNNANNVDVQDKIFVVKGRTLTRTCPHQGCKLSYKTDQNMFVCPCHNSKFNLDGNCISGPACPSNIRV
jgi:Rieske Fe-S protein